MKDETNQRKETTISVAKVATLRAQFERCKQEIGGLDWLSEGSVSENHPGTWRWTRKVKAKTVTVALSEAQAEAFATAIANHRCPEALIHEMRRPKGVINERHSCLTPNSRAHSCVVMASRSSSACRATVWVLPATMSRESLK
jgi:hypothetical protein